jgi:predicted nucleic acid-binding protein
VETCTTQRGASAVNSALIDTPLLLDYLRGDQRALKAMDACTHRSISVVTWLELMAQCPPELVEPTRGFLRTFERLSVSESIADEALRLVQVKPGLSMARALTWATATVNQLRYLTCDATHVNLKDDLGVHLVYRGGTRSARGADALT